MQKLLVATNNPAKIHELSTFLTEIPFTLVTLKDIGVTTQAPEDGRTFQENAIAKARFYRDASGLPSLADDGGIEIDALHGEPGVDSHRWISKTKDDEDEALIQYTYERIKNINEQDRGAQMRVVLALALLDGREFTTEGVVRGVIAPHPSDSRTHGFPFRSVFYIPEIKKFYDHNLLTEEETMRYNHRRQAVENMKAILKEVC